MTTIHPVGTGRPAPSGPDRGVAPTRSAREGSAAGMLVAVGAFVVGLGLAVHLWADGAGQTIAVLGMLVLLPAALLQAVIGMIDGVRDHDQLGESRSAAFALLGVVVALVGVVLLVAMGL